MSRIQEIHIANDSSINFAEQYLIRPESSDYWNSLKRYLCASFILNRIAYPVFNNACFYIINLYTEQCNVFSIYFNYSSIRSRYFLSTFDFRPITFCMITGVFLTFNVVFVGVSLYNEACNNNIKCTLPVSEQVKENKSEGANDFFLVS